MYIRNRVVNQDFHGYRMEFWTREFWMKIHRNLITMAAVAAALTIAAQARANTISFFLTTLEGSTTTTPTNGAGSAAPIPQVMVTIDELTTTTATVVFQQMSPDNFKAPVGINVNGFFDVTAVVGSGSGNGVLPCGFGLGACTGGGTNHAGSFNFETSAVNTGTITISLTAENGTTWADAYHVLAPNSDGWEAADNMASTPQALGTATPLPAALPLFVSGIGGLGLLGWRRKRKAQASRLE
jgi:hypothetical protein